MANIIEFEDKVDLIDSPEIPDNQKLKASEINKIRDLINEAYYRVRNLEINGTVGGDTVPVGTIMNFTGDGIQKGWLVCDGRDISRTEYADLFSVIGTKYGVGDGTTTFNLPSELESIFYGSEASGVLKLKRYDPSFKVIIKAEQVVPITSEVVNDFKDASKFNAPSALLVKNSFSNPNILINGDFQVWQRGTEFTVAGYTADRWLLSIGAGATAKITKLQKGPGMHIETTGNGIQLDTLLEGADTAKLSSNTVTISLEHDPSLEVEIRLRYRDSGVFKVIGGTNDDVMTVELPELTNANQFDVSLSIKGTGNLYFVKLELGEIATPFVPRSYAEELALCQRYGIRGTLQGDCLYRSSVNGNDAYFYLPIPTSLRTKPTFVGDIANTLSIAIRRKSDNSHIPIKSVTCEVDPNEIQVICTLNSNVNGNPWEFMMYVLYGFFDAEIY